MSKDETTMTLPTEEDISWLERWSTMQPVMKQKFANAAREALRLRKWMERIAHGAPVFSGNTTFTREQLKQMAEHALAGKECP